MEYSYSFYIKDVVGNNKIRVILKNLDGSLKVRTLGDLQNYILHSKNYFKFTYNKFTYNHNHVTYITCGKNLIGCNSSRIYNSIFNPPLSEKSGALLCDDWEGLVKVIEMEFPKVEQKEPEKMNVTYVTPIEVMQKNPGVTYIVDDGTGKIAFQIIDSELGFTYNNNDIQHFKSWRLAPNIPSNAYPGSIAEMKKINFSPDAQWLNEIVKSGAKFRKQNQTDEIDINAIKKLLPQGWTLNQYADHVVIK